MFTTESIIRDIEGFHLAFEEDVGLTVRDVLSQHFNSVKIDKSLMKRIYRFQIGYVNTSREYVEFFGSNLLGVHVIRFREADVLRFYNEVLNIDFLKLEEDIRKTDTIKHEYKISGDIFNLTMIYLIHRALKEKTLVEKDRYWMAYNAALIFYYRTIAAFLSKWFTYPADPKVAQAAYANLNYKYLIKKLGSWHRVLDYRANELVSKKGLHYKKLLELKSDEDMVKIINDSTGRIKDMLLNYYSEFDKVRLQGDKIGVSNPIIIDAEGEEVIKDNINNVSLSVMRIKQYITDSNSFIKEDLIRVIIDINKNTSYRLVKETLTWMCNNVNGKDFNLIDSFISQVVIYSYYLIDNRLDPSKIKDLSYIIIQLKNYYLSTRSTDIDVLKIRELADKIIYKTNKKISKPLLLSTRTALILYITLRVLIKNGS